MSVRDGLLESQGLGPGGPGCLGAMGTWGGGARGLGAGDFPGYYEYMYPGCFDRKTKQYHYQRKRIASSLFHFPTHLKISNNPLGEG